MRKLINYLILWIFISASAFLIYVFYLLIWPFQPLIVKNGQNIPVDRTVYVAGDPIVLTLDYVKSMAIPPTSVKDLVCNTSVTRLPKINSLPAGRHVVEAPHIIPPATPTDTDCRIFITLNYKVNPIRTITVRLRTTSFSVINHKL